VPDARVVIARIGAAHGIRGEVRVKSFAAVPLDAVNYGPLTAPDGRQFTPASARRAGASPDMLVVKFAEVGDRNTAETLNGTELSVARSALPPAEEGEFYHADLVGLSAFMPDGTPLGTVVAVQNYGAGDLIEIERTSGGSLLVPFTAAAAPEIDVEAGRIVVIPPDEATDDE
jgi:16S rRNA processing protein RimM